MIGGGSAAQRDGMMDTVLAFWGREAKANECSAMMTDISFDNVSPVADQDYFAMGTLSVTCTFAILAGNIILLPSMNACANLGPGSGSLDINTRVLTSGTKKIPFNLYRSASYTPANSWGGYVTQMAMTSFFNGLLAIGANTQTYPVHAKIAAADLAGIPTVANGETSYTTDFTGAGQILYASASTIILDCQVHAQTAPFTFAVWANVVNDCIIGTTPLSFGTKGMLTESTRALGALDVKCTAASSYRIDDSVHLKPSFFALREMTPREGEEISTSHMQVFRARMDSRRDAAGVTASRRTGIPPCRRRQSAAPGCWRCPRPGWP